MTFLVTIDHPDSITIGGVETNNDLSLEIGLGVQVGNNSTIPIGVNTVAGASVLNRGSILASANGVDANDVGVTNVFINNTANGQILGVTSGVLLGSNRLFNAGTIEGGREGVVANAGSTITNLGTISANLDGFLGGGYNRRQDSRLADQSGRDLWGERRRVYRQ